MIRSFCKRARQWYIGWPLALRFHPTTGSLLRYLQHELKLLGLAES